MEGCAIFWVHYVARDPIPPKAVTAGHKENGDSVYVTKFDYNHPPLFTLPGHYVEGAEDAVTTFAGIARRSTTMMMIVVL